MNIPNYIIGTGYHSSPNLRGSTLPWLFNVWEKNTLKYSSPKAIYVTASGDGPKPDLKGSSVIWIPLFGNLGYCGDLIHKTKPHHFPGSIGSMMSCALLSYASECDLIYKEQDVMAFGPYVETMYSQIGDHGCIFGSCVCMGASASLLLVRHRFIPEFVRIYLGTPHESDPMQTGEAKFGRFDKEYPQHYCRYSFGYDRDRPINMDDPVFYAQKITPDEMRELGARGLLDIGDIPSGVPTFSNY